MFTFALFVSIDPSLGRVDYSLFSDQTLMEMFIEGFDDETKKKYKNNDGMYRYACEWSSVKCDDEQRVIEIDIDSRGLSGSLELCYAPPKLERLMISTWRGESKLTGSAVLKQLPDGMKDISIENNQLTGEVDLINLPDGMKYLQLDNNLFTGEVDLTQLPKIMKWLSLQANELSGEIDLTQLQDGMEDLHLNKNHFTGNVVLTHLPKGMQKLLLQNNLLSGSVIIKRLPQGMEMIDLRDNNFNAIAVVGPETEANINLKGSGVTSVVDENGAELDMKPFW